MADKKYLLSNGEVEFVPLEFENDFFKDLEKLNLTAQLITDEPGKLLGTSLSQNNQQQDTELQSVDGSLDFKDKVKVGLFHEGVKNIPAIGPTLDLFKNISTLGLNDEDRNKFYQLYSNKIDNIKPRVKKQFKSAYAALLDFYKDVDFTAIATGAPRSEEQRREEIKKIDEKILKQISSIKELEFKDEGLGIVKGFKEREAADVLAAAFFTPIQFMEMMIPARLTGGLSLIPQIAGPMYYDFNEQKALRLYGQDDPKAFEKLVENNETEILIPIIAAAGSIALERVGLKGVDDYVRSVPGLAGSFSRLFTAGNKEGLTEIGQFAIENVNASLGQGDTLVKATAKGINSMFTDEGLESFLQGFIGGGTIAAGGKAINRALRSNKNSAVEINKYIDNLSQLNIQKNITQDN